MSTTREGALDRVEHEVGVLIRRVRRVIHERARAVDPELQPSSYLMLGYLRDHGPLRASALCTVFDIDKGAISRQVQNLVDLGLVDRTADPDDGRATLISLSDDGTRRLAGVSAERRTEYDGRLRDWSTDDLVDLADRLGRYNAALGADD